MFADPGAPAYALKAWCSCCVTSGSAVSPFNAFLIAQGLETLSLPDRTPRRQRAKVAEYLAGHDDVVKVNFAGLPRLAVARAGKEVGAKGNRRRVVLRAGRRQGAGKAFVNALTLHSHVANIGDVRSLVIHPASTTHQQLSAEEQLATGVTPGLVRLAVGWRASTTSWRTRSAVSPPPSRCPARTPRTLGPWRPLTEPDVTLSDERTVTLPPRGRDRRRRHRPADVRERRRDRRRLDRGAALGELSPNRDNVVVVLHALTGDSHITGPAGPGHPTPGWWDGVAGPGAPIDTDRWCAIATNVLGGCRGSTGPSSLARDGKPWGLVSDDHRARPGQRRRRGAGGAGNHRRRRGDRRLDGWGAGPEWIVGYPERVRAALVLAVGARATADQIGTRAPRSPRSRPTRTGRWRLPRHRPLPGRRAAAGPPVRAPDLPRRGRTRHPVRQRRGGDEDPLYGGRYAVQSYLEYQGAKLTRRFDAAATPPHRDTCPTTMSAAAAGG